MINVIDRVAQNPGRVKLTPVSGQTNIYDMERADNPYVVGTPINKTLFDSIATDISSAQTLVVDVTLDSSWTVTSSSHTYLQVTQAISDGKDVVVQYAAPDSPTTFFYHRLTYKTYGGFIFTCVNPTVNNFLYGYSRISVDSSDAWSYSFVQSAFRFGLIHNTNNTISSSLTYANVYTAHERHTPFVGTLEYYSGIQSYGLNSVSSLYMYNRNEPSFTFYFIKGGVLQGYKINSNNTWTIL